MINPNKGFPITNGGLSLKENIDIGFAEKIPIKACNKKYLL